ncbi:MAG: hypothetical protein GY700_06485 [Propionibacteriaceae bacterium]|nr:hypothetical protein [Propionibacteriaceae bacterium]
MSDEPKAVEVVNPATALELPDAPVDILRKLEERNELLNKVLGFGIRSTRSEDWSNLQGKPWPNGNAVEKMARRCAVSIEIIAVRDIKERDEKGEYVNVETRLKCKMPGGFDVVEGLGYCSTRDQFLGTETRDGRDLKNVDMGHIRQASYTNAFTNGVTRLLGVRNLSWERLGEFNIYKKGAGANVTYGQGQGSSGARNAGNQGGPTLLTEGQSKAIFAIARDRDYNPDDVKTYIKEMFNVDSSKKLTRAWASDLIEALKGDTFSNWLQGPGGDDA